MHSISYLSRARLGEMSHAEPTMSLPMTTHMVGKKAKRKKEALVQLAPVLAVQHGSLPRHASPPQQESPCSALCIPFPRFGGQRDVDTWMG